MSYFDDNTSVEHNALASAWAYTTQCNYGRAFANYLVVLKLNPQIRNEIKDDFVFVMKEWTDELENGLRFTDLFKCYDLACELFPDCEGMLNNIGAQLFRLGYKDEGVCYVRRALKINPSFIAARENLENICSHLVERWHFRMLNDSTRNKAFYAAIGLAILDGHDTVLDIGSGTGLLSMFAVAHGAQRVTACEQSKTMKIISEEALAANNMLQHVNLIPKASTDLLVPSDLSRVSMVVTETFDAGLFGEHILTTLKHAWTELLLPSDDSKSSLVIPQKATLYVCAVESQFILTHNRFLYPSLKALDMSSVTIRCTTMYEPDEPYTTETLGELNGGYERLTRTVPFMTVDFNDIQNIDLLLSGHSHTFSLPVTRRGRVDALVMWFDLHLYRDIHLSTSPDVPNCWQQAVFPVFQAGTRRGLNVSEGEAIDVECRCGEDKMRLACVGVRGRGGESAPGDTMTDLCERDSRRGDMMNGCHSDANSDKSSGCRSDGADARSTDLTRIEDALNRTHFCREVDNIRDGSSKGDSDTSRVANVGDCILNGDIHAQRVDSSVDGSVTRNVDNELDSNVDDSVGCNVNGNLKSSVNSNVSSSVDTSVYSNVSSSVDTSVYSNVDGNVNNSDDTNSTGYVNSSVDSTVNSVQEKCRGVVMENDARSFAINDTQLSDSANLRDTSSDRPATGSTKHDDPYCTLPESSSSLGFSNLDVFNFSREEICRLNDVYLNGKYCEAFEAIVAARSRENRGNLLRIVDVANGLSVLALQAIKLGFHSATVCTSDVNEVRLLKCLMAINGIAEDRVHFVEKDALKSQLICNEKYDVIVGEIIEPCGVLKQQILEDVDMYRETHLARGGVIIPSQFSVYGVCIESDDLAKRSRVESDAATIGFSVADFINVFQMTTHVGIQLSTLNHTKLSETFLLFDIDLNEHHADLDLPSFLNLRRKVSAKITESGRLTAVVFWFEVTVTESAKVCTYDAASHWKQAAILVGGARALKAGEEVMLEGRLQGSCVDIGVIDGG